MTLTSPWCCSGNSNEKSKGKALVKAGRRFDSDLAVGEMNGQTSWS